VLFRSIDDSQDDVLITKRVLFRLGRDISALSASSGEEGFALLHDLSRLPALIFLDLKMPRMDGLEVLRRIRSDERLRDIPVVVVTHSTLQSDTKASLEAGADEVIHKAFDMEQFGRELGRVIDRWLKA